MLSNCQGTPTKSALTGNGVFYLERSLDETITVISVWKEGPPCGGEHRGVRLCILPQQREK